MVLNRTLDCSKAGYKETPFNIRVPLFDKVSLITSFGLPSLLDVTTTTPNTCTMCVHPIFTDISDILRSGDDLLESFTKNP